VRTATRKVKRVPAVLSVDHLYFEYARGNVLDDVTFSVERGQFCALLGPNGAGKSTLFSLLSGLLRSTQGRIKICGEDMTLARGRALARMGIVFQQSALDLDLTVQRNLSYYAALRGLHGKTATRQINAALERMGLSDRAHDRARDLNGGHRRRTEIARALLHTPDILLLDEPTVGLDPQSRADITTYVHDLCSEQGLTVLWATHLVDEVRQLDDVVILHHGRVLASGSASDCANGRPLKETFLEMTGRPA
jgi:ABC-2 type transport system ATP-binding protein